MVLEMVEAEALFAKQMKFKAIRTLNPLEVSELSIRGDLFPALPPVQNETNDFVVVALAQVVGFFELISLF